jgi:hypothetical protein
MQQHPAQERSQIEVAPLSIVVAGLDLELRHEAVLPFGAPPVLDRAHQRGMRRDQRAPLPKQRRVRLQPVIDQDQRAARIAAFGQPVGVDEVRPGIVGIDRDRTEKVFIRGRRRAAA